MIHLKPTSLFAVEVPEDAYNFGWLADCFTYDYKDENNKVKHKWLVEIDNFMRTMKKKRTARHPRHLQKRSSFF